MARKSKSLSRVGGVAVSLKNRTLGAHATFPTRMSRAFVEAHIPRGWSIDWASRVVVGKRRGADIAAVLLNRKA